MKRWLIVLALLLVTVSVSGAAPQIVIESLNHDFGDIIQGDKLTHVFRFRNAGDAVLQISNVRSSCGCTGALLSASRLSPGDLGELRLTFDSTNFKGAIQKTVSVDSNDPAHPQINFALQGNVKAEILLEPERVNWGRVQKGSLLSSSLTLTNVGSATIRLQSPTVTSPDIQAILDELILPPGKQVKLQITAKFSEQKTRIRGYVIIATDYPKVPQIRVPVAARLIQ